MIEASVKTPHSPHIGAQAHRTQVTTDVTLPTGRSAVSATASRSERGAAVTLINRHYNRAITTGVRAAGMAVERARVPAADVANAVNSPQTPDRVAPRPLAVTRSSEGEFTFTLPAHSMATIELRSARAEL